MRQAFGVYALGLLSNSADFVDLGEDALTEGSEDKDVDLCLVDVEAGTAYIAQCYVAEDWNKPAAPSNKADDLLTGLSWLLHDPPSEIPEGIRSKACDLQSALSQQELDTVFLLYIHNCRESENVRKALRAVSKSARSLVEDRQVTIEAIELGLPEIQRRYLSLSKQIVVDQVVEFACPPGIPESGDGWSGIVTTVDGAKLHDLWSQHGDDLFSANIRGFLDMLRRKTSINKGILETIQREPDKFWAYNNGITVLTKKIETTKNGLRVNGLSVINGAQTTGVIGNALLEGAAKVKVLCRFIECRDAKVIAQIIENNNTQNAIKSFDFRSNDPTQRRIAAQLQKYGIVYKHRREGATRLPPGAIQAEVLAPYLAAFHGHFQIATRQRRTIFEDRSAYDQVFPATISAEHLYLVQCLVDALGMVKQELMAKADRGTLNRAEESVYELMKHSTSKFYACAMMGYLSEMILDRSLPGGRRFAWSVRSDRIKEERSLVAVRWKIAVEAILPLVVANTTGPNSNGGLYDIVRSAASVTEIGQKVVFIMQSLKGQLAASFEPIREVTQLE